MKEMLMNLLAVIITAAVPVLTTYAVGYIKKIKETAQAETDDIKKKGYIEEIATAISDAKQSTGTLKNTSPTRLKPRLENRSSKPRQLSPSL